MNEAKSEELFLTEENEGSSDMDIQDLNERAEKLRYFCMGFDLNEFD